MGLSGDVLRGMLIPSKSIPPKVSLIIESIRHHIPSAYIKNKNKSASAKDETVVWDVYENL